MILLSVGAAEVASTPPTRQRNLEPAESDDQETGIEGTRRGLEIEKILQEEEKMLVKSHLSWLHFLFTFHLEIEYIHHLEHIFPYPANDFNCMVLFLVRICDWFF